MKNPLAELRCGYGRQEVGIGGYQRSRGWLNLCVKTYTGQDYEVTGIELKAHRCVILTMKRVQAT